MNGQLNMSQEPTGKCSVVKDALYQKNVSW